MLYYYVSLICRAGFALHGSLIGPSEPSPLGIAATFAVSLFQAWRN